MVKVNYIRCVWPGISLPLGKSGDYVVDYFKEKHDINIEYLEETKTSPGQGTKGSRVDQIFNVLEDSIHKFAQIKSQLGALYAKEVVQNNEHHLYMERIYLLYFKNAETELLKAGDISEKDVYQVHENK